MNKVILILLATICLLACEKTIDLNIPVEDPKMVLHSYLNPDSAIAVHLSSSAYVLEKVENRQNVLGATVRVFEDDKELGTLAHIRNGWYKLDGINPKAGKTYRIEAEKEGMDKIIASEAVLQPLELFDLRIDTLSKENYGYIEVEISFSIKDPPGENFYMSSGLYHTKIKTVNPNDGSEHVHIYSSHFTQDASDPALESFCYYTCVSILRDSYFDGKEYRFRLRGSLPKFENGEVPEEESFSVNLYNVSRSYYLYHATLQKNMESRYDPFAEPSPIFTNVEGGYGILGAISISEAW